MAHKHKLNCAQCGNEFECSHKRKYCGPECRPSTALPAYEPKDKRTSRCELCGTEYQTHIKGRKYCSRRCNVASWREKNLGRHRPIVKAVVKEFKRIADRRDASIRKQEYVRRKIVKRKAQLNHSCASCSTHLGEKKRKTKYCDPCRNEISRARKRADKALRRARIRSGRVDGECVDPFDIFERDGWLCHLCGCKTLKSKRGSNHNKAPELEHILPLSKGGRHTASNLACSCRECNGAKGATIMGQPSLLGLSL